MTVAEGLPDLAQGARIGRGCFIDSLELTDCDLLNIGDEVVVNEGASLIGHYFKDGHLHFGEVGAPCCFSHPPFPPWYPLLREQQCAYSVAL